MSKSPLRKDKTCLNCNHVVDKRFCPNCGQENTDTRKTFHHLFIHFFEDLTHYENAFWKTIKNLIFKPAALTKEYLSGKRLSYLAPVRLYIFISFVTFFIIAVFPNSNDEIINVNQTSTTKIKDKNGVEKDSIIAVKKGLSEVIEETKKNSSNKKNEDDLFNIGYKNVKELDSLQKNGPAEDKLNDFFYSIVKKGLEVKEKNTQAEILEKFVEGLQHNFPKALFIYMPLFAFVLWLFHGKKRWFYFDHGIFTLHYFSFLLLSILIVFISNKIINCFVDNTFTTTLKAIIKIVGYSWMFYYFFPAHHRFYGETRFISFLKSITMFIIDFFLIGILLIAFMIYTYININ